MVAVLTVVPARGGSKGVPNKNLRPLGGIPLIAHVLRAARACRTPMRIIVSTDSAEIAAAARDEGAEVPFMRPAELAGDAVAAVAPAQHAARAMDALGFEADIVVALHPTSPFLSTADIDEAVQRLMADPAIDSAVAVRLIQQNHPFRAYALTGAGLIAPLTEHTSERYLQKQDRPAAYGFCGGLYVRRRALLEAWDGTGFGLGQRTAGVLVAPERAIDIDTELDLVVAEAVHGHFARKGARP